MESSLSVCKECHSLNRYSIKNAQTQTAVCGKCGAKLDLHGAVSDVSEKDFWRILRKAEKPVIVDFWAAWCGPCQMYGPTFQEASLISNNAVFLKVDTEKNMNLMQQLGIQGIPATIVFKNSKEVKRQAGALPLQSIIEMLKEYI